MIQPEMIIIADDHPLFRQALLSTLREKLTRSKWIEAQTIAELERSLLQHDNADLLLLDLNIPDAHGFNTLIHVRNHFPQIPVVIVSAHEDHDIIHKAIEFGAAGFIPKSASIDTIFDAIKAVLAGDIWMPEDALRHDNKAVNDVAERMGKLTQQQYKILMMFAQGLLNKQIAFELSVSEATIKAHATAIFRKLKVRNRTQAVIAMNQLDIAQNRYVPININD